VSRCREPRVRVAGSQLRESAFSELTWRVPKRALLQQLLVRLDKGVLSELEAEAKRQARRRSTRTGGRRTELAVDIAFGCSSYLTLA
jgi:hypothetical protein